MSRAFFYVFLCSVLLCVQAQPLEVPFPGLKGQIDKRVLYDPAPYILPSNHHLKPILDSIFPSQHVMKNVRTLREAGFIVLMVKKSSGIVIVRHPKMHGYIVKLYLVSKKAHRSKMSQQAWLIQRCRGAAQFRQLIRKKQIQFFAAPKKWLYEVPNKVGDSTKRIFIVVETYMNLVSKKKTIRALKRQITKQHLRELLLFEMCGGAAGPGAFPLNAPYTKEGKFAFIDTEYPDRVFSSKKAEKIGRFFSPRMRKYWIHLVHENM